MRLASSARSRESNIVKKLGGAEAAGGTYFGDAAKFAQSFQNLPGSPQKQLDEECRRVARVGHQGSDAAQMAHVNEQRPATPHLPGPASNIAEE